MPKGRAGLLVPLQGDSPRPPRTVTGIDELDRVTGGGLVPGSGVLIGGDPGIGKSTLLLQAMAALARTGSRVIYVSGEEAIDQVRLRAERLGVQDSDVLLLAETNVSDIVATLKRMGRQHALVIDRDREGRQTIRGLLSTTQIGRQLGVDIDTTDVAGSFAELARAG